MRGVVAEFGFKVAERVKAGVRTATMGQIQDLAVEPLGDAFVLKGSCSAFYLRKEAIDAAKLHIAEAVESMVIPDVDLIDLIEVQ